MTLRHALTLAALLPLAACASYNPHMMGAHPAAQYDSDLASCRTVSREQVREENAKFVWRWIGSAYYGPGEVRAAVRSCMEGKGYAVAALLAIAKADASLA